MNAEQFCAWLSGYFDLAGPKSLAKDKVAIIEAKLRKVIPKTTVEPSDAEDDEEEDIDEEEEDDSSDK